jgi:D-arginine dehydrogenase
MIETEIAIVGAGIAGASAAALLARAGRRVLLLEREDAPGYHTSGRSAALFSETYGNAPVRALSVASRAFLEAPPDGFADHPILSPRGALHAGVAGDEERLAALHAAGSALVPSVRLLSGAEARALVPALKDVVAGGVFEPDARDIDTNAMLQGYLRLFRVAGGRGLLRAEVTGMARDDGGWRLETAAGTVRAEIVVNAAGAWADRVGGLAGLAPLGIAPKRRTAFLVAAPDGTETRGWPLVVSAREDVYFKPDSGMLLCSPADETPSEPMDAQADDLDIAIAVDRLQGIADIPVRRIQRSWAGLRTFAPDRTPVVGFDPRAEGFFWLAGQGGYGFQTAPALAEIAASLVGGRGMPAAIASLGLDEAVLAPGRFGIR